jgi:hypothetical protein
VPAPYTFGNLGRNTLRGPATKNFDASLGKDFRFTEARILQLRADAFNALNNVHFGLPIATVSTPTFMKIQSAGAARELQLSLKLLW